jgi:probable HAF family extracellular repeat protein
MRTRRVALSVFSLLISLGLLGVFDATAQAQEGRPNVVFIVTDDQGFGSQAYAVSDDGLSIAGRGVSTLGLEAFLWTESGGMVGLGDLPNGIFQSSAFAISADGSVVVGSTGCCADKQAFRWTEAGGMVGLGDLPGGAFDGSALAISADGSIVVGEGTTASGGRAFIWDEANHMCQLDQVLTNDFGLDLEGWTLVRAMGISDDGLTIVGQGLNPSGENGVGSSSSPSPPPGSS